MGSPVDSDVVSATAVAARGWQAEVLAKAAFIGGPVQGLGLVHTLGGAAVVFTADGELCEGPDWHRFVARPPEPAAAPAMSNNLWWYTSRAGGLVAAALLAAR